GAAELQELEAAERQRPVAAVSGGHVHADLVDEVHGCLPIRGLATGACARGRQCLRAKRAVRLRPYLAATAFGALAAGFAETGYTDAIRLSFFAHSKVTTPSILANRVWSLPSPTFWPGRIFVPRWRTMTMPDF